MIDAVFLQHLLIASCIMLLAAFVQSTVGFGLAIVAAPLLFMLNVDYVPAPIVMATAINTIHTLWHYRRELNIRPLMPAFIARVPGGLAGTWLLLAVSVQVLAVIIAVVISLGILANILKLRLPINRYSLASAGFLAGISGTATAIGGPPMVIVLQGQPPNQIRSQLAAFFLFGSVLNLLFLLPTDYLTARHWLLGLPLIPAVLLGSWLGSLCSNRIKAAPLRWATIALCTVSVVVMLVRTFR